MLCSPASLHTNLVTTPNEPSCDEVTLNIQSDTTNEADAITDISVNSHAITKVGDAKHSSTETILGASSLYFDGNGDYLSLLLPMIGILLWETLQLNFG